MRYFYFPPLTNRIHKNIFLQYSEHFWLKIIETKNKLMMLMIFIFPKLVYAWLRQIPQTGCGIIYPVMYKIVMMMVLWYDTTIHWYPLLPRLLIPRTIPFFPLSPPPLSPLWPRASIIAARMSGVDNYLVSRECDGARDGARDGVWLCLLFCHHWHSPQWAALLTQPEHTNALLILTPGDTNNPSKDIVTTKENFSIPVLF